MTLHFVTIFVFSYNFRRSRLLFQQESVKTKEHENERWEIV